MKKLDILGRVLHFDPERNVLTYKLNFVTPEIHKEIENLIEYPYFIKNSFKTVKPFRSKTYKQQKQFWVDFGRVLKAQGIERSAEVDEAFYEHIKKIIFPARKIQIGFDENNNPKFDYYAPDMKDLSIDEMAKVITVFREKYEYLHIDWEKIE